LESSLSGLWLRRGDIIDPAPDGEGGGAGRGDLSLFPSPDGEG